MGGKKTIQSLLPSSMFFQPLIAIPEPATAMLGMLGLSLLGLRRRRVA